MILSVWCGMLSYSVRLCERLRGLLRVRPCWGRGYYRGRAATYRGLPCEAQKLRPGKKFKNFEFLKLFDIISNVCLQLHPLT